MDTREGVHEAEEENSDSSAESVTESVGSPQESSDITTVLDSDEQEEEEEELEERPREGTDTLEQHHENERVIEPPAPHRLEENDDANSEDF